MKRRPTLLLDCDGVICDANTPVHRFAERLLRRDLPPPSEWTCWDHAEAMQLTKDEARDFHNEITGSDIAFKIKFYEGAEEIVHQLKQVFDVCFVTAEWKWMPAWVPARQHLLERFACDVIFTHAKWRVAGDILCDDRALTIERGGPWKGVLFRRPWNSSSKHVDVVENLEQVLELA